MALYKSFIIIIVIVTTKHEVMLHAVSVKLCTFLAAFIA